METFATRVLAVWMAIGAGVTAQEPQPPAKAEAAPKVEPAVVLQVRCSDTWLTLAQSLCEEYRKANANTSFEVSGGGTAVALASLGLDRANVAIASRQATDDELKQIRAKGTEPMEILLGYEAMAIVVPKDNPLPSLTLAQLADLYGAKGTTQNWAQLGVTLPNAKDVTVHRVGRQPDSGPYEHFVTTVLGRRGVLHDDVHPVGGSKDMAERVAKTPNAIGYCPPAFVGAALRVVPVAAKDGGKPLLPSDADYPLRRPVYAYFRDDPSGHAKRFALWIKKSEAWKASGLTPP